MDELIEGWRGDESCPVKTIVKSEELKYLTESKSFNLPKFFIPKVMHNDNNFIISLGSLCKWLGTKAEAMGIEIYPGFAASDIILSEDKLAGIITSDLGLDKDGKPGSNFQPGIEIHSKYTLFAEGCRGHLGKRLIEQFNLRKNSQHQTYGIGLKELWEVKPTNSDPGHVMHTIGWPLDTETYGGSFLYHLSKNLVSVGFVIGLDYKNPYMSPYDEFQRFKTHPLSKIYLMVVEEFLMVQGR